VTNWPEGERESGGDEEERDAVGRAGHFATRDSVWNEGGAKSNGRELKVDS
jgi:hypothetical protein